MKPELNFLIFTSILISKVSSQCENGYHPHKTHCDRYYYCRNGKVREGLCPDGLVFDERSTRKLRCVYPFGIDCRKRPNSQPPKSTRFCPRLNGYYAARDDCTKFYNCADGRAFLLSCPDGLAYDEYSGTCNWPDLVESCNSENIINFQCPEPTEEEILEFGDPRYETDDCRKFIVCVESATEPGRRHPRLLGCEEGKVFNPITKLCDKPMNVPNCVDYYGPTDFLRLTPSRVTIS